MGSLENSLPEVLEVVISIKEGKNRLLTVNSRCPDDFPLDKCDKNILASGRPNIEITEKKIPYLLDGSGVVTRSNSMPVINLIYDKKK